jgi:STE24 endopeptidase
MAFSVRSKLMPPIELAQYFSLEDLDRGTRWLWQANLVGLLGLAIDVCLLFVAAFGGPGHRLWSWCERVSARGRPGILDRILGTDWRTGALFLGTLALIRNGVCFPINLWHGYFQEHAFGLSHEGLGTFLGHIGLGTAVGVATNALVGASLGAVRRRWPRRWWLAVGAAAALLLIADTVAEPLWTYVDFRVHPLEAGPLRQRLEAFLASRHVAPGDIVVVETSKHGTSANAAVTGLGPTRRLVLTDTLIGFGDEAVMGAVAHEVGHRRDERLPRRLLLAALSLIGLLWLIERALRFALRHGARQEAQAWPFVRALSLLLLLAIQPVHAALNRNEEREADEVELSTRRDYDVYVTEQVKLSRSNATAPFPPAPWRWIQDHPSPSERIARALWYKARMTSAAP